MNNHTCPFCGEEIKDGAIKCKHCKSILGENQNGAPTNQEDCDELPVWGAYIEQYKENTDTIETNKEKIITPENRSSSVSSLDSDKHNTYSNLPGWQLASHDRKNGNPNSNIPHNQPIQNHSSDSPSNPAQNISKSSTSTTIPTTYLEVCSVVIFISYVASAIFVGLGFHKMFAYNNPDSGRDLVNAYVGGDAYNYIINANYATAYFTLAIFCAVVGMTAIISYISIKKGTRKQGR